MVRWLIFVSLIFSTNVFAEEIGGTNRYIPLIKWDDSLNAYRINSNFKRLSANGIVDRGYNYAIGASTINVSLNNVQDDNNYSCIVTLNYQCQYKVIQKTTTGFALVTNGTVSDGKFDWIIAR